MNKRYLVFIGSNCYPSGGMHDLKASFEDRGEAIRYAKKILSGNKCYGGWAHIYDSVTGEIVESKPHWFDYKGE